jgi:hypothetical protein
MEVCEDEDVRVSDADVAGISKVSSDIRFNNHGKQLNRSKKKVSTSVPRYLRSQKYELISYSASQFPFNKAWGQSNSLGDDVFPPPVKLKAATDQNRQSMGTKGKVWPETHRWKVKQ